MTPDLLRRAIRIIRQGGVVAVAFEHQLGLAVDARNPEAVDRVLALKDRSRPLPVIAPSMEELEDIVELSPEVRLLAERFWPGPLTLILPVKTAFPSGVLAEDGRIGVRLPGPCPARELCREAGTPLTATSANAKGEEPPTSSEDLERSGMAAKVDLVIPGRVEPGLPSTVAEVKDGKVRILRQGAVELEVAGS